MPYNFTQGAANNLSIQLMAGPNVDLGIEKTYTGIQNGRTTWDVKVTNRSSYGSQGFTVDDVLPPKYTNVRVDSYGNSGWITPPIVNGNTLAFSHGRLPGGATATFKLSAATVPNFRQCMENTATVTGGDFDPVLENNTDSDDACPLQVKKTIVDVNGDGKIDGEDTNQSAPDESTRKVSYTVEVTYNPANPAAPATDTYTLTDTPHFPDEVPVMGGRATSDRSGYTPIDFPAGTPVPWSLTPSGAVAIDKGQTHRYTIDVYYAPTQVDPTNTAWAMCTGDIPGRGLYNEATITTSQPFTFTDNDCAPIIKDTPIAIKLIKHGDSIDDPLSGAAFGLFSANEDNSLGEQIQSFIGASGTHTLAEGVDPGTYFIVETQSPPGYSLLPAPVRVNIARDTEGKATATIDESSQITAQLGVAPDNDTIVITVANVRIGDLPDTGGIGVWPFMIIATGLFAAAGATARREA